MSKTHTKLLGELASARRGITYSESALRDNPEDGLPYINMKSFLKDGGYNREGLKYYAGFHTTADLTKENDLLIANTDVTRDGDIIGVPALLPNELKNHGVLFSHHVTRLSVSSELDTRYLYYLLCSDEYRRAMKKYARGTTVLMLDMQGIQRIPVRYPATLEAQKSTAHVLASIDIAIEKTEALIDKYQQIRAGLMHDLFTRGVLPNGKLRPPREQAPELYQETAIGWIPREWHPISLRDLVGAGNIVNGPFGSDLLTSELKTEGVPVLYVQDIKPGFFSRVSSAHVTEQKANELAFCNVRKGDVLVAKVGDPPCDSCVYEYEQRAVVTQDVIRIRTTLDVDSLFLASLLISAYGRKAIKRISIEGTRERVSLTEFKSLVFPVAPPDEQLLIAQKIGAAQAAISAENCKLAKLTSQKRGLMHDLLTGKVSVNIQEPEVVDG